MTKLQTRSAVLLLTVIVRVCFVLESARSQNGSGPDPREIPIPAIRTAMKPLPGVKALPVRAAMPDVMLMNNGTRVATPAQWAKRRADIKRILEYYFAGLAPPPPGNVKGREIKSQMVLDEKVKYRLIHLTFGPNDSLSLDIGVFTPVTGGPFPALIMPGGTPPGATALPRLPQGPGQGTGVDALLAVGSDKLSSLAALGVNWGERPHGMVQGDWDALLAFADKFLLGKKVERPFDQFPAER